MVVNGIVSLRAADKFAYFRQDFKNNLELGCNATFSYVISNRWIAIRLDIICALFISVICLSVVLLKGSVESSLLIMTLQIGGDIIFLFSIAFRMYAEIENSMTSSQRMIAYTKLEEEDDLEKPSDAELAQRSWPP